LVPKNKELVELASPKSQSKAFLTKKVPSIRIKGIIGRKIIRKFPPTFPIIPGFLKGESL